MTPYVSKWRLCRFCGESADEGRLVKYGVRHYAHYHCYLDHKQLSDLWPWQVRSFPHALLKERGLLAEAAECSKEKVNANGL